MFKLFSQLATGALLLGTSLASAQAASAPEVTVREGALSGQTRDGITAFLGIPYAAPPVGDLRWRMPQPATHWSGQRSATRYGPPCAQPAGGAFGATANGASEDCLTLNIWKPSSPSEARLPVMLYVHGGGFIGGSGSIATLDGSALARKGVIVVTINYRLGIFGFFAHPELSRESGHRASGNYGLADQAAAMKWVRDNIAAFGGDTGNVTIFGQSAGSISVLDQMTSPLSRGLFHRVIAESGTPMLARGKTPLAEAETEGAAFVAKQNSSIAQLRNMPAADLMARWTAARGSSWPIVDGWVLPEAPSDVFAAGREARVPLMTGSNAREGLTLANDADLPAQLRSIFGDAALRAEAIYQPLASPDPVLGSAANAVMTDTMFRCPAVVLQGWHARRGAPVYAYHFEDPLPGGEARGSQHSDEVSFVFGSLDMLSRYMTGKPTPPPASRLSEQVMTYWTNFAKSGDPNSSGVPHWPRFTSRDPAYQRLNSVGTSSDVNLRGAACALYRDAAMNRLMSRSIF